MDTITISKKDYNLLIAIENAALAIDGFDMGEFTQIRTSAWDELQKALYPIEE